ncbi:MAG: HupE/UreJ family protein [Pseudomonadota bacterium]
MHQKVIVSVVVTLVSLLFSPFAAAHTGVHVSDGLVDGFMHPVSGIDHLLVAITAGFWAARAGSHGIRDMSFFLILFATGLLLGAASQAWPQLEVATPLLFLLIVTVIAVAIACPHCFLHAIFGSFALWHGMVHMLEMPAQSAQAGFAIGLLLSTSVLLTLGLIVRGVIVTRRPHGHA